MAEFGRPVTQFMAAQVLRGLCEHEFEATARKLGDKVHSSFAPNARKNYSFFRIVGEERIALTQHRVEDFRALPREAKWRNDQIEQQYSLALDGSSRVLTPERNMYALMTHGSAKATDASPSFIHIRFPLAEGDSEVEAVDVLHLIAADRASRASSTRIERTARPKLVPKENPGTAS